MPIHSIGFRLCVLDNAGHLYQCTNGTNQPFVFAWLTSQLMRCSLQMVYRSTEELTIRSNGTNQNQSTDYFSICTNGTNGTNRPFVFACQSIPLDSVCVYWTTLIECCPIHTNGIQWNGLAIRSSEYSEFRSDLQTLDIWSP